MDEQLFKQIICPFCGGALKKTYTAAFCKKRHSFDISKAGYLNLLTRPAKAQYDKDQFAARRLVYENGFYEALADALAALCPNTPGLALLDAGCGEGHHLSALRQKLLAQGNRAHCAGFDITKDAVALAAKADPETLWFVADLSAIPFADKSFDIILDILSPANYAEFARLLRPDGRLIKVIPGDNYLIELRKHFFGESTEYSTKRVADYFAGQFEVTSEELISYTLPLPKELAPAIAKMTPMTWNVPPERIAAFIESPPERVTFEFMLICGRSRGPLKKKKPQK